MPKLKSGTIVSCRVKFPSIVSPYKNYDEIKSFVIVAADEYGYYLHVPHYYSLKDSVIADRHRCRKLGIEKRFLNEEIIYIQENMIAAIDNRPDGICCKKCHELYMFAESNQEDGTLICYSCRQNPYL